MTRVEFLQRAFLRPASSSASIGSPGIPLSADEAASLAERVHLHIDFDDYLPEFRSLLELTDAAARNKRPEWWRVDPRKLEPFPQLLKRPPDQLKRLVIACLQWLRLRSELPDRAWGFPRPNYLALQCIDQLAQKLLPRKLPWTDDEVRLLLRLLTPKDRDNLDEYRLHAPLVDLLDDTRAARLTDDDRALLRRIRAARAQFNYSTKDRQLLKRLDELVGDVRRWPIDPGEAWSDAALVDLAAMPADQQSAWRNLLEHAATVNPTKPSAKWTKDATPLLEAVHPDAFTARLDSWFARLGQPGAKALRIGYERATNNTINSPANTDLLCGLAWLASLTNDPTSLRALADAAEVSYRNIAAHGPRNDRLAGAAVRAIAAARCPDAVPQLARLELRVRQPGGRKLIKKLMEEVIARDGLSRRDVEEATVPDFGLVNGATRLQVGNFTAELRVTDSTKASVTWHKPDGKTQSAAPPAAKREAPDAFESLKRIEKDLQAMLPAQRTRLELLLRHQRSWTFAQWRDRYLSHGLVGTLARRLIWTFDGTPALPSADGTLRDVHNEPITCGQTAEVALWHPVGRTIDEITAWRSRLEESRVVQPFKQAHREIYILTDAERRTNTYSNRFAAHIVKTHVLVALCQQRGWKAGMFGGDSSPTIDLPDWHLRATFWADVADYERTNAMGMPLYLSTDQVRFYLTDHEAARRYNYYGELTNPVPLDCIPPQPFSELMRDADLFVGIASVGNDPNWQDAGPDGRYRDYWHAFSFGDLNASAKTRRQVLDGLVPRLKIASRCTLTDRFLRVRGDLRAYKIHLGSGNILMEPNDQYLCIVPDRSATRGSDGLFLPFEGDQTLSVILSKAFLLAADTTITDPTITRQIRP